LSVFDGGSFDFNFASSNNLDQHPRAITMTEWTWLRIGAISGGLAVAAGAFGAHVLRDRLDAKLFANFQTATEYQMYHALALLAIALVMLAGRSNGALTVSAWAFLAGTVLFSGSLYALALTGQTWLGMITPFGGGAFLVGWFALAAGARP
jgi:uncharacterized membrane protein YgdD (TMEM256/DUF423 family)